MSERMVFDTSMLISAALYTNSVPFKSFEKARKTGFILRSIHTASELKDVLSRSKFDKYISQEKRLDFLANYLQRTTFIEVITTIRECRDPKDDKFLELAVDGQADFIITSDDDLLVLHPFRDTQVLTPRAFLDLELT